MRSGVRKCPRRSPRHLTGADWIKPALALLLEYRVRSCASDTSKYFGQDRVGRPYAQVTTGSRTDRRVGSRLHSRRPRGTGVRQSPDIAARRPGAPAAMCPVKGRASERGPGDRGTAGLAGVAPTGVAQGLAVRAAPSDPGRRRAVVAIVVAVVLAPLGTAVLLVAVVPRRPCSGAHCPRSDRRQRRSGGVGHHMRVTLPAGHVPPAISVDGMGACPPWGSSTSR